MTDSITATHYAQDISEKLISGELIPANYRNRLSRARSQGRTQRAIDLVTAREIVRSVDKTIFTSNKED